jgi:hypothetical protein
VNGGFGEGGEQPGDRDARRLFLLSLAALALGAVALIVYVSVH